MLKSILSAFLAGALMIVAAANADEGTTLDPMCSNSKLLSGKLITDICWDCLFPLRMAGINLAVGDGKIPPKAYDKPFCVCFDGLNVPEVGFSAAMWEPAFIIEHQRTPGCMSSLNGTQINAFDKMFRGTHDSGAYNAKDMLFAHYHYYSFPLLSMLDLFTAKACNPDGYVDIDLLFFSEIDPTWNLDELAFFTTPEAALVSNPLAITACTADAISSTAKTPIESMFWCAGAWGSMYPLTGNVTGGQGIIRASSLQKARVLNLLHRRGVARETVGQEAMCYPKVKVTLPKSQYKFTQFFPVPETKRAHLFGESTLTWGTGRTIPAVGDDPIYMIWRWKDCCLR
ncbi:TraU family protein [Thiopseudomonas alkaliphila]|uniref:TraU family protein n=1 Tax=Thiopseudomonas alkaliphila TaxID=1697053 RepID=UPI002574BB06|nr:TraU family protein [Thiopseudomonas alkaliphila]MDM1717361.1 TraU family protein [Thiopseudomonas alkaliphila]